MNILLTLLLIVLGLFAGFGAVMMIERQREDTRAIREMSRHTLTAIAQLNADLRATLEKLRR